MTTAINTLFLLNSVMFGRFSEANILSGEFYAKSDRRLKIDGPSRNIRWV
jgi:hypothetical protein